jgi:YkoY family integral membrane protein
MPATGCLGRDPPMFGQTFAPGDLATIVILVLLEGLLSIDNALVLGVIVQRLEPPQRKRALSYGLIGGFILRLLCIAAAAILLRFSILKLLGGLYLLWISADHFLGTNRSRQDGTDTLKNTPPKLWRTIAAIELTDLAFAADSILAAVALVGPAPRGSKSDVHPKFWVIAVGGMFGIVLMRFAAVGFAKMIERFPRLHRSAYWLVLLIGLKLLIDWGFNGQTHPHRIDFQDPGRPELWIFWTAVLITLIAGFTAKRPSA